MIWKHYLKLSEIESYSKLARTSKAPPPPPPGGIGLNIEREVVKINCLSLAANKWAELLRTLKWMPVSILLGNSTSTGTCSLHTT